MRSSDAESAVKSERYLHFQVVLALMVCQALIGGWPVMIKSELHGSPLVFMTYRMGAASVLLFILSYFTVDSIAFPESISAPRMSLLGFLVMSNCLAFLLAVECLGSFLPSVGEVLIPVVVVGVCVMLGMESISWGKVAGIFCGVMGAFSLLASAEIDASAMSHNSQTKTNWGFIFAFCDILATTGYFVVQKDMLHGVEPVTLVAWSHLWAFFFSAVSALSFVPMSLGSWAVSDHTFWSLCYAILGESLVCYVLLAWANKASSPTVVAASVTMQPVFAAIFQYIVMGTGLAVHDMIGACLVISGLVVTTFAKDEKKVGERERIQLLVDDKMTP